MAYQVFVIVRILSVAVNESRQTISSSLWVSRTARLTGNVKFAGCSVTLAKSIHVSSSVQRHYHSSFYFTLSLYTPAFVASTFPTVLAGTRLKTWNPNHRWYAISLYTIIQFKLIYRRLLLFISEAFTLRLNFCRPTKFGR